MARFCVHPDDDCPENHLSETSLGPLVRRRLTSAEVTKLEAALREIERNEMKHKHERTIKVSWVEPLFGSDGRKTERRFVPECSCGWQGSSHSTSAWAHRDFRRHVRGPEIGVAA